MYIGPNVTVAAGARVKEAIILDRAEIQVCHESHTQVLGLRDDSYSL